MAKNKRTLPAPNTWDNSNQHWVSQFLLKGFGLPGNASHVYTLDKRTLSTTIRSVDDVASKVNLLTAQDNSRLTSIERSITGAVQRLRKGHQIHLAVKERQLLNDLVLSLILADPYSGVKREKLRKDVVQNTANMIAEIAFRNGLPVSRPRLQSSMHPLLPEDVLTLALDSENSLTSIALSLMGLSIHKATKPLVIGDSPVMIARARRNSVPSLLNFGSEIALPIAYNCVLVYDWVTEPNTVTLADPLTNQQSRLVGHYYWSISRCRYVFSRTRDALYEARMPYESLVESTGSVTPSTGWHLMQEIAKNSEIRRQLQDDQERLKFERGINTLATRGDARPLYEY